MKKTHGQNHFHCVDDDECEEFEHCFCPEHASYVQSRFHEVLLDFFSAHNFEGCPEHGISCEHFYDKKIFKDINRERFAADWGSVRTGIRSDGELKYSVGKVPQQLSRPKVTLLPDKPSESSHPGVVISWAKKTPRVDIIQYFLELRIQNCEELDSWVLIYQGTDKQFTCTRLPRGAKCCFRVQGENENGKGKWSEESVIVVPGTPINSSSHTESTQSKRKKKRKRKKAPAQSAFQLRAELTELLNCPATEPLESFIRRVKEIDPFSAELQGVLEDARTALEIKVEEVALRSQLSRTRRQKIEEELLWAQAKGNSQQLEDCIERARQEGISIQQAEKTLRQLGRVTAVRARLQEALSSNNIDQLETAIEMAEQWENSQLHCEIQACTDKIRQLSVPADEYSRIEKPTLPTASSDTKESSSFSSGKSFQAKDFRVTEEDKQNVLSQLKALSRRPEKEISQSDLVKAIHCAAPWATEHPFIEFISEFNQRIQLQQEITFGKKLLEAALLSENVEEIVRCLQQVLHMKNFGLENEIRLCSQTLERMHIMELKHLLKQYCSNPQSVPDIQQLLQQAMIYQDVLKKEIITAQDQLRTVHSHHSHSCSDHHSHHRCRHRL